MCYDHQNSLFKFEMVIYIKKTFVQNQMNYVYDAVTIAINLIITYKFVK